MVKYVPLTEWVEHMGISYVPVVSYVSKIIYVLPDPSSICEGIVISAYLYYTVGSDPIILLGKEQVITCRETCHRVRSWYWTGQYGGCKFR